MSTEARQIRQWLMTEQMLGVQAVPGRLPVARSVSLRPTAPPARTPPHAPAPPAHPARSTPAPQVVAADWQSQILHQGGTACRMAMVAISVRPPEHGQARPWVGHEEELLMRMLGPKALAVPTEEVLLIHAHVWPDAPEKARFGLPPDSVAMLRDEITVLLRNHAVRHGVLFGALAAQVLAGKSAVSLQRERGNWFEVSEAAMQAILTLPPQTLLATRDPMRLKELRGMVWADLQALMAKL